MVDETQNANLQQTGSSNTAVTGNPQQIAQTGLQPQSSTSLQPTSTQTINSVNQLDQGTIAISFSGIANTTTTSTQQTTITEPATFSSHVLVYGAAGIVVVAIMAGMVYSLLRQH